MLPPSRAILAGGRACPASPVVSGSSAATASLYRTLADRGGQQVLERYGMTETLMNVCWHWLYDGERRPGSVGLPLPRVELRPSTGQEGEIQLRGPNIFTATGTTITGTAESFTDGCSHRGPRRSGQPTDIYASSAGPRT